MYSACIVFIKIENSLSSQEWWIEYETSGPYDSGPSAIIGVSRPEKNSCKMSS